MASLAQNRDFPTFPAFWLLAHFPPFASLSSPAFSKASLREFDNTFPPALPAAATLEKGDQDWYRQRCVTEGGGRLDAFQL